MNYKIRKKERKDCAGIARVITVAWNETYRGIVSDEFLDSLYINEEVRAQNSYNNFNKKERNRLVLSKGHCSPALYAALAEKGIIKKEELKNFRNINSKLQGHPNMNDVPGVDMSSGSLGQGLSVADGMAISAKLDNLDYRVYCILGDGEIEEGQVWEAAMAASKYKLDNLCVIVDNNNLQIDGKIEEVMSPYPIDKKFESFGFYTITIDGNNIEQILQAFKKAKENKNKPTCIIAKTIKGKGVSFMEDKAEWHGKAPNKEEFEKALRGICYENHK